MHWFKIVMICLSKINTWNKSWTFENCLYKKNQIFNSLHAWNEIWALKKFSQKQFLNKFFDVTYNLCDTTFQSHY